MSRARVKVAIKEDVRRLSGGEVKVRRYIFGEGEVTVKEPSPLGSGRVKRGCCAVIFERFCSLVVKSGMDANGQKYDKRVR